MPLQHSLKKSLMKPKVFNVIDQLWKALLLLTKEISSTQEELSYISFTFGASSDIKFNSFVKNKPKTKAVHLFFKDVLPIDGSVFLLDKTHKLHTQQTNELNAEELLFLKLYLPYCCLPIIAKKLNRAIAIGHFAQTLDGKIATHTGDSKWIGNDENLIHAHRMRALCDAILIGSKTLKTDDPSLTVRKVEGGNPMRVVIGSSQDDYSSLIESCKDPVIVIGDKQFSKKEMFNRLVLKKKKGKYYGIDILENLYKEGIHTVLVEGGATTTSNFLNDKAIDILQLHIAPLVFGSGIQAISLPQIDRIKDALSFHHYSFQPIGDTVMFTGQLNAFK